MSPSLPRMVVRQSLNAATLPTPGTPSTSPMYFSVIGGGGGGPTGPCGTSDSGVGTGTGLAIGGGSGGGGGGGGT